MDADEARSIRREAVIRPAPTDCWVCQGTRVFGGETCLSCVDQPVALTTDPVIRPAHYTAGSVECIDAIRGALTPAEFRGYCKGNVMKYAWRERAKGGDQDLAKAAWYLAEVLK